MKRKLWIHRELVNCIEHFMTHVLLVSAIGRHCFINHFFGFRGQQNKYFQNSINNSNSKMFTNIIFSPHTMHKGISKNTGF